MKKLFFAVFNVFTVLIMLSCSWQNKRFIPEPDFSVYDVDKKIAIDNVIETKDGASVERMPEWLLTFIRGGNQAVEQLDSYRNKYVFIGLNEGENFIILNKWAENFSAEQDFAILAAIRIEERIVSTASLYPEYEYGMFFEELIQIAYGTGYPDAVKQDTYWFKKGIEPETYNFFILITIEKTIMQSVIRNMMTEAYAAASPRRALAVTVNKLRQSFFEGF